MLGREIFFTGPRTRSLVSVPGLDERVAVAESRVHAVMLASSLGVVVDWLGQIEVVLAASLIVVVDCLGLEALIRVSHGWSWSAILVALVDLGVTATHFEDWF